MSISIEEYYDLIQEWNDLINSEHPLCRSSMERIIEIEGVTDEFEKMMFPIGEEPARTGGRF